MADVHDPDSLRRVAGEFCGAAQPGDIRPFHAGHIHSSYVVETRDEACTPARILLQRINEFVFPNLSALSRNIRRVTDHIRAGLQSAGIPDWPRCLRIVPARSGEPVLRCGRRWRAFEFIENTTSRQSV